MVTSVHFVFYRRPLHLMSAATLPCKMNWSQCHHVMTSEPTDRNNIDRSVAK